MGRNIADESWHGSYDSRFHREPKHGYCPECWAAIHNRGAHAEECPGYAGRPGRVLSEGENPGVSPDPSVTSSGAPSERTRGWTGWFQCNRCYAYSRDGGGCRCGGQRWPVMNP